MTTAGGERRTGLRLRFVRRNGPSLLVADNARLTGRGWAVGNFDRLLGAAFMRLQSRTTLPIFILVPQVTLQQRLYIETPAATWARRLPVLVDRAWVGGSPASKLPLIG